MAKHRKTERLVQLCGGRAGYQYFYSLSDGKVYSADLSDYAKDRFRVTPGVIALAGPLASLLRILFGDIFFTDEIFFLAVIFAGMLLEIAGVYSLIDQSQRRQDTYVRTVSTGRLKSRQDLLYLYAAGKRERSGMLFFIVSGMLFSAFGLHILITELSAQGLVIFYLGVFVVTDFTKLLSPLGLLRAKRQFR